MIQQDPEAQSWADNYKLLVGAIVPRPIAFVSTVSAAGTRNLAAFSFFNGICPKPFLVSFAPMRRTGDGKKKDTLCNIEATGQFVINIVDAALAPQMNQTSPSPEFDPDVDEWDVSGLTPLDSVRVTPARVAQSPIHLECELVQVLDFGAEPGAGSLVIGRVVLVHLSETVYDGSHIDPQALDAVARMAGSTYARSRDRFELPRPSPNDWLRRQR